MYHLTEMKKIIIENFIFILLFICIIFLLISLSSKLFVSKNNVVESFNGVSMKYLYIWQGTSKTINTNDKYIYIQSARYGRNHWIDVTSIIQSLVFGKNSVSIFSNNTIAGGDPQPNRRKILRIRYFTSNNYYKTFTCFDGAPVRLSVENGKNIEIKTATYGARNPVRDYTQQIQNLVNNKSSYILTGGIHTQIGDPERGVRKTFTVVYTASKPITEILNKYIWIGYFNDRRNRSIKKKYYNSNYNNSLKNADSLNATIFGLQNGQQLWYENSTNDNHIKIRLNNLYNFYRKRVFPGSNNKDTHPMGAAWENSVYVRKDIYNRYLQLKKADEDASLAAIAESTAKINASINAKKTKADQDSALNARNSASTIKSSVTSSVSSIQSSLDKLKGYADNAESNAQSVLTSANNTINSKNATENAYDLNDIKKYANDANLNSIQAISFADSMNSILTNANAELAILNGISGTTNKSINNYSNSASAAANSANVNYAATVSAAGNYSSTSSYVISARGYNTNANTYNNDVQVYVNDIENANTNVRNAITKANEFIQRINTAITNATTNKNIAIRYAADAKKIADDAITVEANSNLKTNSSDIVNNVGSCKYVCAFYFKKDNFSTIFFNETPDSFIERKLLNSNSCFNIDCSYNELYSLKNNKIYKYKYTETSTTSPEPITFQQTSSTPRDFISCLKELIQKCISFIKYRIDINSNEIIIFCNNRQLSIKYKQNIFKNPTLKDNSFIVKDIFEKISRQNIESITYITSSTDSKNVNLDNNDYFLGSLNYKRDNTYYCIVTK